MVKRIKDHIQLHTEQIATLVYKTLRGCYLVSQAQLLAKNFGV